ncbi:Gfo/Idh/MocA family protein [Nonomuraea gerenzanensis]|uniref:Oxidoreductase family, NAD-binding Rossmann fold domain protein n=1 Tax=Nonomuraea gerenzanensis TaxID=93944 RepID=A0A1M4E4M6_9ACTN|nr:Gfo/Idh/MocA family oxidoreductase [Nonomuraea gerenzanensis]UBU16013.1 Gfo/Idh/MocA family oxidoreductase [Nonomuraea gerenzanensis]SBO93815.1 oxidoreductase family, NAD-binding Rossmann fold domain protein [Nonomuraea gerenzanensis]
MSQRTYRAAIVGTGAIAHAHAQAVQAAGGRAELVAVADVDAGRAREFADKYGVPHAYGSAEELLDAQELDLAHLCTPPALHTPIALACLEAGVTALVEKPPTLSLAELDTLIEAEGRSTARVATVLQHRFGPGAVRLRRLAGAGTLGRALLATSTTQWYRDEAYYAVPWRGTWESEGGGPTMGHGIHQFDLLLSVLGPWSEVTAVAVRQAREVDTEDVSMALVTFESGAVASVVNSVLSPRQTSELRFDYERATVEVEHLYGYTDDDWTITPAPGHDALAELWGQDRSSDSSGHGGWFAAVLDALDQGQAPPVTTADTRRTMEFIAALYASAFTGERVRAGQITADDPFALRMDGTGAPWRKQQ